MLLDSFDPQLLRFSYLRKQGRLLMTTLLLYSQNSHCQIFLHLTQLIIMVEQNGTALILSTHEYPLNSNFFHPRGGALTNLSTTSTLSQVNTNHNEVH